MFRRIGDAIRRFMYGRYGTDELNMTLLFTAVAISLVNTILSWFLQRSWVYTAVISSILYLLTLILLGVYLSRSFSRNIYKRQRENKRFQNFIARLKDRSHRYFRCPGCKQIVRVPRHKGKISIRCPKCGNKFVKKT